MIKLPTPTGSASNNKGDDDNNDNYGHHNYALKLIYDDDVGDIFAFSVGVCYKVCSTGLLWLLINDLDITLSPSMGFPVSSCCFSCIHSI